MTDKHPLYHAICLWASEPDAWAWQELYKREWIVRQYPPGAQVDVQCRLVHRHWLRDRHSVTVYAGPRLSSSPTEPFRPDDNPTWNHETYEYRVEPRKRTGRMVEAPGVGTSYYLCNPQLDDWHSRRFWAGTVYEHRLLERGLCHYDADSAIAAAKRMSENARQGTNGDDER